MDLNIDIFANTISNLSLIDQIPPFPKYVERTFSIYSRDVTPILSPLLVTPPGEESLKKADHLIRIREPEQTFHRIALCTFTEPRTISELRKVEGYNEVSLVPEILYMYHPNTFKYLGCSVSVEVGRY